jgi:uncharacterized protein YjiK
VIVDKKFFIAYKISGAGAFSVYNTDFSTPETANTAWLKEGSQWVKATEYTPHACSTSLALQPLLRYRTGAAIPPVDATKKEATISYNKTTNQLSFISATDSSGEIFIYSVSGQLVDRVPFSKGEKTVRISPRHKGTIGIVKVINREITFSGKIIY